MVRSLNTIHVALLEVQCVLDEHSTLVLDLLQSDLAPFALIDGTFASRACRFSVCLTWIYQLPSGFWRLSGVAADVSRTGFHTPREMFEIIVTHLDAPETGRDSWLLENITVIQAAFSATAKAQEARRYEVSDFESGSDEIREFVRKQKESLPTWGAKLVPPSLLENVAPIAILSDQISASESHSQLTMMQNHYQNFADTLIPQIEDRSPRDAASDPRLRPLLIEMMKDHLTGIDQQRRNIGLDFDLNPLLEELGLWEIIQPPAPCGNFGSEEEEEEEE